VHDVEAFGPVSTVMPYDTLDEAIALTKLGKGSLVSSVFTDDPKVRSEEIGDRRCAVQRPGADRQPAFGQDVDRPRFAAGPLVHGGPGRAGGGEEMGGMRGVKHYMQRTAVQGTPELLSAVTGRWIEGAETRQDSTRSASRWPN
jgi:oxepin-CoA hydrolase/3-oxo-5,6-dehydrosuberyl-CoA semialdehyde dehydrogenase